MDIEIEPGTYVVAVSGGVDSAALLDLLKDQPNFKLIVAHYDHGIRYDSELDRKLVQKLAKSYDLPFVYEEGNLGDNASEAEARAARYKFLHRIKDVSRARAIITAHHQDDLVETAILNMLRGTGRRGLSSLKSTDIIKRPLVHKAKKDLIDYARQHNLEWREDSTNQNTRYLRNYIRHKIVPVFSETDKDNLLKIIVRSHELNQEIDNQLINHLHIQDATDKLDRHWFIMLPHIVAKEIIMTLLRRHNVKDISSKTLERLVTAAKTLAPGQQTDVDKRYVLKIDKKYLALTMQDR